MDKMTGSLRAGVACVDISPGPGVPLAGYPHFPRPNTGIHDPLYAGCIVLEDGITRLALVCMDLLMISRRYVRAIRQKAEAQTGIPAANIMICCSHTHSSPWGAEWFELGKTTGELIRPEAAYMAVLENKLVDLIAGSARELFDARMAVDKISCGRECGIGGNRRDPNGPADPEVWAAGVQDSRGTWRACLVRYALHPTVIHEDSSLVTADYPAYIREELSQRYPGMILLFAQGAAGDQSTRYFRQGQSFAEAGRIGKAIGCAAGEVLARMAASGGIRLGVWSATVALALRKLPGRAEMESRVTRAKTRYAALKAAGASYLDVQNANLTVLGEEDTLAFVLMKERGVAMGFIEDELPAEVQVIGIGDTRIVCLPGEVFVEFGRRIQAASPFPKTFVVTLANGILPGYVCTAEAYSTGGYEAGASLLTHEAGEALTTAAVNLLQHSREECAV
jgi:hypothetical protein